MGLAERRAAKEFETGTYPKLKKDLEAIVGFEVPFEVHWDTLATEGDAHLYADAWPKIYFEPLAEALKAICVDDLGKDALKQSLKKVVVWNKTENYSPGAFATFEGGTLTLDHRLANVDDVTDRAKALQGKLEAAL